MVQEERILEPERIRNRITETLERLRERLRLRPSLGGEERLTGQVIPRVLGGGRVLEALRNQVDTLTARWKERRPAIVPAVSETVEKWEPGRRVREVLPPSAEIAKVEEKKRPSGYSLRR